MWIVYTNILKPEVVNRFPNTEQGLASVWELVDSNQNYWFWFSD